MEAVIGKEEDVKKQEEDEQMKREMAELRGDAMPEVSKPAEEAEPQKEEVVKSPEEITKEAAQPTIEERLEQLRGENEKLLAHKTRLETDNYGLREKRRQDLEKLSALQTAKPDTDVSGEEENNDTSIDPEVTRIIRSTVEPELAEVKAEIRQGRFASDEARVKAQYGEDKYKSAIDAFSEIITPESNQYDPAIHESFMKSKTPAQFAYKIGMASSLESYIETVRKETAEKTKKETLEELKGSAIKTIPSLSNVSGGTPQVKKPSTLAAEMDELRKV